MRQAQIMTPFCIFPIDAGDKRCPLGNVASFTLKTTLKGWKWISSNYLDSRTENMKTWQILHLDMTGHLHPGRRCRGSESPASRNSSFHGAGCQGMDKSCLKFWFSTANLLVFRKGWKTNSSSQRLVFFHLTL